MFALVRGREVMAGSPRSIEPLAANLASARWNFVAFRLFVRLLPRPSRTQVSLVASLGIGLLSRGCLPIALSFSGMDIETPIKR